MTSSMKNAVTHHGAAAPDLVAFAAQRFRDDRGNETLIFNRYLVRAIRVRDARNAIIEPMGALVHRAIFLDGKLAEAVGADGIGGARFPSSERRATGHAS